MANPKITPERILAEYQLIACSDMSDFLHWGPQGVTLKDRAEIPPEQWRCVQLVEWVKGQSLRITLYDKLTALRTLGEYLKMFEPEGKHNTEVNVYLDGTTLTSESAPLKVEGFDVKKLHWHGTEISQKSSHKDETPGRCADQVHA